MASPRLNKYKSEDDKDYLSSSTRRTGLSDYTSKRLEELRLRRAESAAETYAEYRAARRESREKDGTSTTTSSSATSAVDYISQRRASDKPSATDIKAASAAEAKSEGSSAASSAVSSPSSSSLRMERMTPSPKDKDAATIITGVREPSLPSSTPSSTTSTPRDQDSTTTTATTTTTTTTIREAPRMQDYSISRSDSRSSPIMSKKPEEDEYVGFATLPEQVHRKAIKRGFDFVLMVVGETGLGKSTLVTSLFTSTRQMEKAIRNQGETGMGKSTLVSSLILNDLYKDRKVPPVEERVNKTVHIEKKHMEIEEKGVKLRLTIVDTPGFNDSVNAEDCWKPIETYIDDQFDQYYKDESGLNRKNIKDNRVHCCLYFIPPYGHGLRQVDIQFMKRLHEKVNIVPIIAKADTLTQKEIRKLKGKILDQIDEQKIKIYEFPECDSDEDEEFKQQDTDLKASIPFAVIGSNTVVEVGGKKVRGRLYPWGIVEVDNPKHCDFGKLRQMLISTHMQDLKDVTRDVHYEGYRARHIKNEMSKQSRDRNKLKRDSSPNFEAIMDTERLLEQKDIEIRRMQEMLLKMQQQLSTSKPQGVHVNGKAVNGLGNL